MHFFSKELLIIILTIMVFRIFFFNLYYYLLFLIGKFVADKSILLIMSEV